MKYVLNIFILQLKDLIGSLWIWLCSYLFVFFLLLVISLFTGKNVFSIFGDATSFPVHNDPSLAGISGRSLILINIAAYSLAGLYYGYFKYVPDGAIYKKGKSVFLGAVAVLVNFLIFTSLDLLIPYEVEFVKVFYNYLIIFFVLTPVSIEIGYKLYIKKGYKLHLWKALFTSFCAVLGLTTVKMALILLTNAKLELTDILSLAIVWIIIGSVYQELTSEKYHPDFPNANQIFFRNRDKGIVY